MGHFSPLCSVHARHEYFSDGRCRALEFSPLPESILAARRTGLLLKPVAGGIAAYFDEDRAEALRLAVSDDDEPYRLVFRVTANDPLFENYTEPGTLRDQAILYFDNLGRMDGDVVQWPPDGPLIASGEVVSGADFVELKDASFDGLPKEEREEAERLRRSISKPDLLSGSVKRRDLLDNIITPRDRRVRPVAFVCIWISEAMLDVNRDASAAGVFEVRFAARRTLWKYYLFGAVADEGAVIVDQDDTTTFEFAGAEILGGHRRAITFLADGAIPLRDRSDRRFQLRRGGNGNGNGSGKVLVKHLPVASASHIRRQASGGEQDDIGSKQEIVYVSDIYVNG